MTDLEKFLSYFKKTGEDTYVDDGNGILYTMDEPILVIAVKVLEDAVILTVQDEHTEEEERAPYASDYFPLHLFTKSSKL